MPDDAEPTSHSPLAPPHRRRPRYRGKNPRRFEEKYKEHDPQRYADTVAKVLASGKTPAGTHRPIMVAEILEVLAPQPGEIAVDCTLGYGGHAQEMLAAPATRRPAARPRRRSDRTAQNRGPAARARLWPGQFSRAHRSNFAGLPQVLADGRDSAGADLILADLGVSSMQLDDPARGFSVKHDGPLDMRMNPQRGQPASALLQKIDAAELVGAIARENADEPQAVTIAPALAGKSFPRTGRWPPPSAPRCRARTGKRSTSRSAVFSRPCASR